MGCFWGESWGFLLVFFWFCLGFVGVLFRFCWVELAGCWLFNEFLSSAKYPSDADWMRS